MTQCRSSASSDEYKRHVMYLAILIALYLIYGTGDTHNNFIYNEF
ncbi:teichoic acid D-Ala incorporation-associated protein DltX [Staphylococcus cohnii]|nr:teichoic acid D-Ala incorporation-associated protein DltX [Staphylococcus cohnii]